MARFQEVKITEVDLIKLARLKGWSIRQLAMAANVDYINLTRVTKGKVTMSSAYWDKIKTALDQKKEL